MAEGKKVEGSASTSNMSPEELKEFTEARRGLEKLDRDGKMKAILFVSEMPVTNEKDKLRWMLECRTISVRSNIAFELVDDVVLHAEQTAEMMSIKIVHRMGVLRQPSSKTCNIEERMKEIKAARKLLVEE